MSKARERAVLRAIKASQAAADALSATLDHMPAERADDQRIRLGGELREWAGFMEQATWWRADKL